MLGVQLFLHALRMVLGNPGNTIRVSVPLLVFSTVLTVYAILRFGPTVVLTGWQMQPGAMSQVPAGFWGFFTIVLVCGFVITLWTATAWHRFILIEESPGPLGPALNLTAIGRYLLRMIVIGIAVFALAFILGLAGALIGAALSAVLPPPLLVIVVGLIVYLPAVIVFYRLSPILPAAAIGAPLGLGQAWRATRGASGAILVLAFITMIAGWALQQPVAVLGATAPLAGALAMIAVHWASTMFGVSILTTLYGHFVERRELNA